MAICFDVQTTATEGDFDLVYTIHVQHCDTLGFGQYARSIRAVATKVNDKPELVKGGFAEKSLCPFLAVR